MRIRWFARPFESRKFVHSPAPHGFDQSGIGVIDEIQERGSFAVLVAHEYQRNVWRQQHQRLSNFERLEGDEMTEALSEHPVADLIVICRIDDEF